MSLTKWIKRSLILLLLYLGQHVGAQESKPSFDENALKEFAESREFQYMNAKMEAPSLIDQLIWWLLDLWYEFWSNPTSSRLTYILFILIMAGIAVYFIRKMGFQGAVVSGGDALISQKEISVVDERIDYKQLIQESLDNRDFRMAVRYLYLQSLVLLSLKDAVRLAEWKTPYDYQLELKGSAVEPYEKLSYLYEYVWYGDMEVKRVDFDKGRNFYERLEEAVE